MPDAVELSARKHPGAERPSNDRPIPGRLIASVVVVTRDRPEQLARLLVSLVGQTLPPDEVVVVDNGSAKSYAPVFDAFRDRLPLRTFVETAPGIPAARNRGIREARGDLVLFTDDDCEARPDWVERMVSPFYRNPWIGAVGGDILSARLDGGLVEEFCIAEALLRIGEDGRGRA